MADRISRRKLAAYAATKLVDGSSSKHLFDELASYLIESRRTREAKLLVRDIEDQLVAQGIVIADVVTAEPLTDQLRNALKSLVDGKKVHLRETTDPDLIAGIRLDVPGKRLDATVRRKLQLLRAQKV